MADKQFIIEVVEKGLTEIVRQLKQINKEGEKLSGTQGKVQGAFKETDKLAKNHQRGLKGAGDATNNGTHAFAKMARTMDGTLVPAYATVAANVFALTAAFGALERAADLQILIDSAEALAVQTGRNLTSLATSMKEVTGNAISMKEALTSASIAASAGFDNSTIEQLTKVARNASVALGREMTDSLNRVFKGAIKAEPELLDELGIILRLDTAARKYAAALGKSASALTTFEKQQAVVNDVIEQGEKKFGRLSDVDPNPYTQLAAAFHDVSAALISFVSTPVTPVIQFFTENIKSLTAVIILFATSVLKRAFPALTKLQDALDTGFGRALNSLNNFTEKISAASFSALSKAAQSDFSAIQLRISDFVAETSDRLKALGITGTIQFNKLRKNISATFNKKDIQIFLSVIENAIKKLDAGEKALGIDPNDIDAYDELIAKYVEVSELSEKLGDQTDLAGNKLAKFAKGPVGFATGALTSFTSSLKDTFASFISGIAAVSGADASFSKFKDTIRDAGKEAGIFSKSFQKLGVVLGSSVGLLFKAIPIIGSLTIAWQILGQAVSFIAGLFIDEDIIKLNESLEELDKTLVSANKSIIFYNKNLKNTLPTIENLVDRNTSLANILGEVSGALKEVNADLQAQEGFGFFTNIADIFNFGELDAAKETIEGLIDTLNAAGFSTEVEQVLQGFGNIGFLSGDEVTSLAKSLSNLTNELNEAAQGSKQYADSLKNVSTELNRTFDSIVQGLPQLTGTEKAVVQMQELLTLTAATTGTLSDAIATASDSLLFNLGLKTQAKRMVETNRLAKIYKDRIKDLTSQIEVMYDTVRSEDPESQTTIQPEGLEDLEERLENARLGLDRINDIQKVNEKTGQNFLKVQIKRLEKFNTALRDLSLDKLKVDISRNYFSNVEQFIVQLTKATDIEIKALDNLTGQLREQKGIVEILIEDLESQQKDLLSQKGTKAFDEGQLATVSENLSNQRSKLVQLNNALVQNQDKSAQAYLKTLDKLEVEIRKQLDLSKMGSVTAASSVRLLGKEYMSVARQFQAAFNEIDSKIKITDENIKELINNLIQFSSFDEFVAINRLRDLGEIVKKSFDLNTAIRDSQIIVGLYQEAIDLGQTFADQAATEGLIDIAKIDAEINAIRNRILDPNAIQSAPELEELFKRVAELEELREITGKKRKQDAQEELVITTDALNIRNKVLREEVKFGAFITKQDKRRLQAAKERAKFELLGLDTTDLEIAQETANKLQNSLDFSDQLRKGAESMNDLADAMGKFSENLENSEFENTLVAPLLLLQDIGDNIDNSLGKFTKGFASLGLSIENYSKRLTEIDANDKLSEENKKLEKQQAHYHALANAAGSLAGAFEEGSDIAKTFILIQQAAAIAAAAHAVAVAATLPPPAGFASAAAMLALMASILGAAGIAFGSSKSSGENAEQEYKDQFGGDRLQNLDIGNNALLESMDDLVAIDTSLFGAVRDLQISVKNLQETFEKIGAIALGNYSGTSLSGYGVTLTSTQSNTPFIFDNEVFDAIDTLSLGLFGGIADSFFGSTEVKQTLIDAGIEFSVQVSAAGDGLTGNFNRLEKKTVDLIEETTEKYFGLSSSSSSYLLETFSQLPDELYFGLVQALDDTFSVLNELIVNFAGTANNVDFEALFSGLDGKVFGEDFLSLFELEGDEAAEAIASYFSALSEDILSETLPFLYNYQKAGEDLLTTLVRLTNQSITISSALRSVGVELSDLTEFSLVELPTIEEWVNQTIADLEAAAVEAGRATQYTVSYLPGADINQQISEEAAAEAAAQFALDVQAAWNAALIKYFEDEEEFTELFDLFAQVIFDEVELLNFALENAADSLSIGYEEITDLVTEMGRTDLADILDETKDPSTVLKEFYEEALATDAFNVIATDLNGDINTLGADLLALTTKLGATIYEIEELERALEDLQEEINSLNESYAQQILLFGKIGKEAELLALAFDFEAAIKEAEEIGADLALVEMAYGLERLQIVKDSFEQIQNEIEDVFEAISNSTIELASNMDTWDDLAFSVIKINKLVTQLSKGTNNIDLSDLVSDTSDFQEFIDNFDYIISGLSEEGPNTISEEIQLVEDLQEEIINRYNLELALLQEQEEAYKQFSNDIQNYLNDLLISDVSPLTNFERLNEAQNQFLTNAANVFSEDEDIAAQAQEDLLSSADALLDIASEFYSIGPEYVAIFDMVTDVLESIDETLLENISDDPVENAINELTEVALSQLAILDEVLIELEAQNQQTLSEDIEASITEGMMPLLDEIIDTLNRIDDTTWASIIDILTEVENASFGNSLGVITPDAQYIVNDLTGAIETIDLTIPETPPVPETESALTDLIGATEEFISSIAEITAIEVPEPIEVPQFPTPIYDESGVAGQMEIIGAVGVPTSSLPTVYTDETSTETMIDPNYFWIGGATGISDVLQDMPINIHKGETLIPESFAEGLRNGTLTLGETQDNTEVVEAIRELAQILAVSQEDIVDATNRNITASNQIATAIGNINQQKVDTRRVA